MTLFHSTGVAFLAGAAAGALSALALLYAAAWAAYGLSSRSVPKSRTIRSDPPEIDQLALIRELRRQKESAR